MELAPVVLFVYNRPWHTKQTIESLQRNELAKESNLFVFSDGPKSEKDKKDVQAVRKYIKTINGFKSVNIIEREKNLGLSQSIITGVTEIVNKYERIIVLEDDLVVSKYFLDYMNNALRRYKNDKRVMQISGYMFPLELKEDTDTVFLPFITSWGWGTWNRAWAYFDRDMKSYKTLKKDPTLKRKFDLNNSYSYFKMLKAQAKGKIDSWAIRWYLSVFFLHGLILFPVRSLVQNIGFDNTGIHSTSNDIIFFEAQKDFQVKTFPIEIEISEIVFNKCKQFLRNGRGDFLKVVKKEVFDAYIKKIV